MPLGSPGKDRNLDDNLRYFLEAAGQDKELDELYPKLAQAYPSDYVYAYRYAKNLRGRKKNAEALSWIEKAQALAYGANRVAVTQLHAEILKELKQDKAAAELLEKEIQASQADFPKQTQDLRDLLAKLGETR